MDKDQFISMYCKRSGISVETFSRLKVAMPCNCGDESCSGWAAVSNNPFSIHLHIDLVLMRLGNAPRMPDIPMQEEE